MFALTQSKTLTHLTSMLIDTQSDKLITDKNPPIQLGVRAMNAPSALLQAH